MPAPDPLKTPRQQLLAALNLKCHTRLTEAQVTFGSVVLLDADLFDTSAPDFRNSTVGITNAAGEPYEFTTVLHFDRLSLDTLFDKRDKTFAGEITHSHQLLPMISERLGFPVTADDLIGHDIDEAVGYPKNVLVVAAENSLLLYGSVNLLLTGP